MSTKAQKEARIAYYNRKFRDVNIEVVDAPKGSLGTIDGLHYKVSNGKAWRWNTVENDWVLSPNTDKWVLGKFSTIHSKNSKHG